MRKLLLLTFVLLTGVLTLPAAAQNGRDIYDNGPTDGTTYAWTIDFGFAVSNQFTLSYASIVNGVSFAAWLYPGDVLQTAEVSITSDEFGGTTFFDQTVSFQQSGCIQNSFGYNVCNETVGFYGTYLNSGSYWLNLQNAVVSSGDPVYWDQNNGPSLASENYLGTLPSESFTILAPCDQNSPGCGPPPPTTPEPNSFLLLGSGLIVTVSLAGMKLLR